MTDIIPLFSTSASLRNGGIFTVNKHSDRELPNALKNGPISLCNIAKDEGLKQVWMVESNFVNFMLAQKNLKHAGADLVFGLKLVVCEDMVDKSDESFKNESKVVIFLKNSDGYKPLIKIYSKAAQDGFYYIPRIDWKTLKAMWSDNLILALPFYSSFLAKNSLTFASIVPDLPTKPILLDEIGQELPFDAILRDAILRYAESTQSAIQPVKSIYYLKREDAKKWLIWQAILARSTYDKPNFDNCASMEFCWQSYKELTK
jgi:DNA polymerase III alpha subunit